MRTIFKTNKKMFLGLYLFAIIFFLINKSYSAYTDDDFVITVQTTASGQTFTIPTTGGGYNYNVDCDNDSVDDFTAQTGNVTCTYPSAGNHTIVIKDNSGSLTGFPRIYFSNGSERNKIISLDQWGKGVWTSFAGAFYGCSNMTVPAIDAPVLSSVNDMSFMFSNATSADPNTSGWDTSSVTDMSYMFYFAGSANPDTSGWDTSSVTNMKYMFGFAGSANPNTSGWNTSSVTNMSFMFSSNAANPDTSSWNTSSVTNMARMFSSNNVADPDTSLWDTSSVIDMSDMFLSARRANPDTSSWNTSSVRSMSRMFERTNRANPNLSGWDVSQVRNMSSMFYSGGMSRTNYENALINFSSQVLKRNITFNAGRSTYCSPASITAKSDIIRNYSWTITDNGVTVCPNSAPTDISLSSTDLDENTTSIGTLTTTDSDTGDNHTYTLVSGIGSEDNANFNISGSTLIFISAPDFESPTDLGDTANNNSYTLRIQTNDGNGGTYQESFIITVNDLNSAPTDIALSSTDIDENVAGGTTVGTLSGTDDGEDNNTLTFSLVSGTGDTDNASFTLSGNLLQVVSSPDYETQNTYSTRVNVSDGVNNYAEQFTITVNDLNSAPTDIILSSTDVDENVAGGTTVGTLSGTDDGEDNNTLTFSIVSGTGDTDNASFTLSGTNLNINSSPDYETQNTYSIRVNVSDGLNNYAEQFTITVNDLNSAPTDISLSNSDVLEEEKGAIIGILSGTDDGEDTALTFSVTCSIPGADDSNFETSGTNGTTLKLKSTIELNYETQKIHTVCLRVNDGANNYDKNFNISVNYKDIPGSGSSSDYSAPDKPFLISPKTGTTLDSEFTIKGEGEPGTKLIIKNSSGEEICTTIVDSKRFWYCNISSLDFGTNNLTITLTDSSGNETEPISATYNFTGNIDTTISEDSTDSNETEESTEEEIIQENTNDEEQLDTENNQVVETETSGNITKTLSNGKEVTYSLARNYKTCQSIDNIIDENHKAGYPTVFGDISNVEDKDMINAIIQMEKVGILKGDGKGSFYPEKEMTRTEFLKVILRTHCYNYDEEDASISGLDFIDVDKQDWKEKVISKAMSLGIISGDIDEDGNKVFRPNDPISKIEAVKILINMSLVSTGDTPIVNYEDIRGTWGEDYVKKLEYLEIYIPGITTNIFNPNDSVKRKELVKMMHEFIKLYR